MHLAACTVHLIALPSYRPWYGRCVDSATGTLHIRPSQRVAAARHSLWVAMLSARLLRGEVGCRGGQARGGRRQVRGHPCQQSMQHGGISSSTQGQHGSRWVLPTHEGSPPRCAASPRWRTARRASGWPHPAPAPGCLPPRSRPRGGPAATRGIRVSFPSEQQAVDCLPPAQLQCSLVQPCAACSPNAPSGDPPACLPQRPCAPWPLPTAASGRPPRSAGAAAAGAAAPTAAGQRASRLAPGQPPPLAPDGLAEQWTLQVSLLARCTAEGLLARHTLKASKAANKVPQQPGYVCV